MQSSPPQRIALVGFDDGRRGEGNFRVSYHGGVWQNLRPHHVFQNWTKYFRLPWICFLEIALFCMYFFFASFHQRGAVAFTLDFSQSITSFFTNDIELDDPPLGIEIGVGQIYFKEDLFEILNMTMQRFFYFSTSFPCAYPIIPEKTSQLDILLENGTTLKLIYNEENVSETAIKAKEYFSEMSLITASMVYHVQVASQTSDTRMNVEVLATFKHDYDTDTIFMDISHTRFQEKYDIRTIESILETFDFSLPIFIGALNIISVIVSCMNTYRLYMYCKAKANDSGEKPFDVFWEKFDKWDIYALITNLVSIAASIMYLLVGQDIEEDIPPILYVMAAASLLHSMLLIRYLKLKPSTMLIMMVFYNSSVKIIQFLVGCITVFVGTLCFTVCVFGHLSENFASGLQGAAFLFCTMHGDSIKDFYDTMVLQYDVNYYFGFFTATYWILFSLTIMFNITISIVQEMMSIEEYKVAHANDSNTKLPIFNILSDDLALLSPKRNRD